MTFRKFLSPAFLVWKRNSSGLRSRRHTPFSKRTRVGKAHLLQGDRSLGLRGVARFSHLVEELVSDGELFGFVVELDDVRVVHELHLDVLCLDALAVELVLLREVLTRKVEERDHVRQRAILEDGHGVRDPISFRPCRSL